LEPKFEGINNRLAFLCWEAGAFCYDGSTDQVAFFVLFALVIAK
jgi:hypothetical protein